MQGFGMQAEQTWNELNEPNRVFNLEQGRYLTTAYDVFETVGPGNGDVWITNGTVLVPNFTPYLPPNGVDDDQVGLEPFRIRNWIRNWAQRGADDDDYMPALADTMAEANVNWCDMCDVFALHSPEPGGGGGSTPADRAVRFNLCTTDPDISGWLSDVPAPPLPRVDATTCESCVPGSISVGGVCEPCTGNDVQVGNACVTCPGGTLANPQHTECLACAADEIIMGGACAACPFGQGANADHTTCMACPVDDTLDYSLVTGDPCLVEDLAALTPSPADTCPELFVVDIVNLNPPTGELARVWLTPAMGVLGSVCPTSLARTSVGDPAGAIPLSENVLRENGVWFELGCDGDLLCDSMCTLSGQIIITPELMAILGGSLRVVASFQSPAGPEPASLGVSDSSQVLGGGCGPVSR